MSFWEAREGHALFLLPWFGGVHWLLVVDVGGVSSEYGMCVTRAISEGVSSSLFVAPFGWFSCLLIYWSEFFGSAWDTHLKGVVLCTLLVVTYFYF